MDWIPLFKETVFLCLWQENNDKRDILNYFILLAGPNCSLFCERLGRVPTIFWQNSSAETTSYFPPLSLFPPSSRRKLLPVAWWRIFDHPCLEGGGGGGREPPCQRISSGPWRRREPVGLRHSRASFAREIQTGDCRRTRFQLLAGFFGRFRQNTSDAEKKKIFLCWI